MKFPGYRMARSATAAVTAVLLGGGLTIAIAAAPAALAAPCVTSSPTGDCGPYSDPNVFTSSNGTDLVVQNDFSSIPQTLTANGDNNWTVDASTVGQQDQTSVKSYPATQVTYTLPNGLPDPSSDFGNTLTSDFTNVIPTGSNQDYEYAVDDWLADPTKPSWTNDLEIMIWTNVNQQVPAGSPTGQTYTDPSGQSWQVWIAGGGSTVSSASTVSFVRGTIASPANVVSGTIDRMGFYHYLQSQGLLASTYGIDQTNYGLEICSTGGATRTYGISNYTLVPNGQQQNQAPVVSTNIVSGISTTGATLNGSVNPEGQATTYHFEYGPTTAYGTTVPIPDGSAGSGSTSVNEFANLTGLTPNTTYHYRIDATNATGTSQGNDVSFTTSATAQAPTVVTQTATGVSSTGGTLNGTVNPNGQASTYQFEYGTTTGYGSVSPSTPGSAGSGTSAVPETTALTSLAPSTTYHFRLDATNATGTTQGSDQQFTTSATGQAPTVVTQAAGGITSSGAALNGTVNPNSQSTTYQFEYGTTTGYGSVSPSTPGSAGSGSAAVPETTTLSGLTASTTYHFRLDATNATGTTQGSDQQFTTNAAGSTVAYGTTGSAKKANSLTLTWTQTISGTNTAVLAETAVGDTNDNNCGLGITDNGTAMTKLAIVHDNNQHAGYFDVFGLTAPPAGTNTFVATVTSGCSGGTPKELTGGSESFTGVSQTAPFGTAASAFGSGSTATVATAGSTMGNLVAGFAANGSQINSATSPSTSRYIANQDNNTGAGNSAGATSPSTGSAVTMKWGLVSDWWGAAAIEVQHA